MGDQMLELQFQEGTLVSGRRHAVPAIISQVEKQVTKLLNNPSEFPTLKRALTPDDHICLVVHENTNELAAVMKALLEHIQEAGVSLQNCTVLHL
ncbi:MAG TPA: lactate racemase domain-containing protein, partial [Gemmatales bacterium]|nr:lactate racemase domain-containing protein [Gemmatales bacterium]